MKNWKFLSIGFCILVTGLVLITGRQQGRKQIFYDLAARNASYTTGISENGEQTYLEINFKREERVGLFRIIWGNVGTDRQTDQYWIMASDKDGNDVCLQEFHQASYLAEQILELPEPVETRRIRIIVNGDGAISQDGLQSVQVYRENPWKEITENLSATIQEDRILLEGLSDDPRLQAEYAGCTLEQVISPEGRVLPVLENRTVQVGFRLKASLTEKTIPWGRSFDWEMDSQELDVTVLTRYDAENAEVDTSENGSVNEKPEVIPSLQEWRGKSGTVSYRTSEIVIECPGKHPLLEGLGEEGYVIVLDETVEIHANSTTGVRYAQETLTQMERLYGYELPKGIIRDYPAEKIRGFAIDVARNSVSLASLYDIADAMAVCKMNDLGIHLNDNTLLAYSDRKSSVEEVMENHGAFRLESGICNAKGESITAEDISYSQKEMTDFIAYARKLGIQVTPEIDTPAHSLAFTKVFPELSLAAASQNPESADQLDLSKSETKELIYQIWDEWIPAMEECQTLHIGADEYYGSPNHYLNFENELLEKLRKTGKNLRMWGSLSGIRGNIRIHPEKVQIALWNTDWANPIEMYRAGFSILNVNNAQLYIIPGGGVDYLDTDSLYRNYAVNQFPNADGSVSFLPSYSRQLLGTIYMMWNDMSDNLDVGICEEDMLDRFWKALPYVSEVSWNPGEKIDGTIQRKADLQDFSARAALLQKTEEEKRADQEKERDLLLPDYRVNLTVLRLQSGENQVILESSRDENVYQFSLAQKETGKVGFSREGKSYSFDYELPVGEEKQLTIEGKHNITVLYVDGAEVDRIGSDDPFTEYGTFVFPLKKSENAEEYARFRIQYEHISQQ